MHPSYRGRHARIRQTAQEARRRVIALQGPQRFDQQHFDKPREQEIAARPLFAGFFAQEPGQRRETVGSAHVHQRRQQRHQKFGVGRVEYRSRAEMLRVRDFRLLVARALRQMQIT